MTTDSARDHWEQRAADWIELTRDDSAYDLLNEPSFLEPLTSAAYPSQPARPTSSCASWS